MLRFNLDKIKMKHEFRVLNTGNVRNMIISMDIPSLSLFYAFMPNLLSWLRGILSWLLPFVIQPEGISMDL